MGLLLKQGAIIFVQEAASGVQKPFAYAEVGSRLQIAECYAPGALSGETRVGEEDQIWGSNIVYNCMMRLKMVVVLRN